MQDQRELLSIYRKFPCRTLPNAYWKTETRLPGGTLDIRYGSGGELSTLSVWQDNACLAFWSGDSSHDTEAAARLVDCDYALVHASCLKLVPAQVFNQRRAYFRLSHAGVENQIGPLPQFSIRQARPDVEAEAVAGFIQRCYPNITISSEIVRQWLDHPVYDQELWVWIEDLEKGIFVGLGIAER